MIAKKDLQALGGGLLSVVFPYSPSVNYVMATTLAIRAAMYHRLDDQLDKKRALHMASFARTKEQGGFASALLKLVGGWKGTQVYTPSSIIADPYRVSMVLECYFQSLSLQDHRAHCMWSAGTLDGAEPGTMFPCKQIRGWTANEYHEQDNASYHGIGTTMQDRIKDLGVRKNCDWCPHFKMENFKKV